MMKNGWNMKGWKAALAGMALGAALWLPVAGGTGPGAGAAYAAPKRARVSFPAAKDARGVASELAGAADRRLGEGIRSVEEYDDFRAWAAARGLDAKAVKASPHAWVSYALGADGLFGEEPAIRIAGEAAGDAGAGEGLDVSVTVRDGGSAVSVDPAKVAGLFEATSDLQDWDGAARIPATATQTGGDGATLRFNVVPEASAAGAVFLRLALDPQRAAAKAKAVPRSASLTLGTETRGFTSAAASSKEVAVTANVSWTAKSSASWLTVKTASGSGNGKIVYNVAANTGNAARTATITVSGGGLTRTFTVLQNGKEGALYMVVDLSAGSSAAWYPVSYLDAPPSGGWTDGHKTTKLVLRRIAAGSFTMGSPSSESGRSANETQHTVTLSKPYYIGIFEVTQKQWKQVMGDKYNTSGFVGDKLPLEKVSWNYIRGSTGWPASSSVSSAAFMGCLRARTGLADFDLPTEAQWEYACRAGTATAYHYGGSANGSYMWYTSNSSSKTHEVGTKNPNAWGLYDMHGNVWEWCLDWYGGAYGTAAATDPKGASSGEYRIIRGGSWKSGASSCRSAHRGYNTSSTSDNSQGFRVAKTSTADGGGGGGSSATLSLSSASRSFTADAANSKELSVTATVSWTAKSSASWLTVKTASGSGNGKIVYNVAANSGTASRTATITVSGGGKTATFTVTQSGKSGGGGGSATLTLSSSSRSFTADAANSKELSVTATVSWTAKSSASWLTVKTASGSGNGKIVYNVAANSGTASRTATITVSGGGKTATFTVTQSGKSGGGGGGSATLSLGSTSRSFTADAANSKELSVTATVSWTAKSSASWLTVKTASGSGNGKIVYNVAANSGTASRTATITVAGGGKSATFTVTQSGGSGGGGGSATLSLKSTSRTFTADAANNKEVSVTATVSWTAKSSASWLAVKTTSGSGNGKIVYNVAANTGTSSRTATITVSGGGKTATFTVTQSGKAGGVQLWKNGPYWAETNIGADKPEHAGLYFWWGDTVGYICKNGAWTASDGSVTRFEFSEGNTPTYGKDDATLKSEGWITAGGVLAPEHDAAQVHWGGGWRMPTDSEFSALLSNCDWTWTATNGVNGYVVRGKGDFAEASIFVPAAGGGYGTSLYDAGSIGYVWSGVPSSGDSSSAWSLYFDSGYRRSVDFGCYRYYGFSVRPVRGSAE